MKDNSPLKMGCLASIVTAVLIIAVIAILILFMPVVNNLPSGIGNVVYSLALSQEKWFLPVSLGVGVVVYLWVRMKQ
jgi:hypothetical protein